MKATKEQIQAELEEVKQIAKTLTKKEDIEFAKGTIKELQNELNKF